MWNKIETYRVVHYPKGLTQIHVYFEDGSDCYDISDPARASLILDLLRNEKPLYWGEGHHIATGKGPIGQHTIDWSIHGSHCRCADCLCEGSAAPAQHEEISYLS